MNVFGSVSFQGNTFFDASAPTGADNGVSVAAKKVVLGNDAGGNAAVLLSDRVVPLSGFSVSFNAGINNSVNISDRGVILGNAVLQRELIFASPEAGGGTGNEWSLSNGSSGALVTNPLLFMGWNVDGTGAPKDATKHFIAMGIEGRYDPVPADPQSRRSEHYSAFNNDAGTGYRRGWMLEYSHNSLRTELIHQVSGVNYFDSTYSAVEAVLSYDFSGGEIVIGAASRPLLNMRAYSFTGGRKVDLCNVIQANLGMSLSFAAAAPFVLNDSLSFGAVIDSRGYPVTTTNYWNNAAARPNFVNFIGGELYGYGAGGITDTSAMLRIQAGYQGAASAIDLYATSLVGDADRCIVFYTAATECARLQGGVATFAGKVVTDNSGVAWGLGAVVVSAAVLDNTKYVSVNIAGVAYKLALIV